VRIGIAFVALGAGIFVAFMLLKALVRAWPSSPAKKQLVVLSLGALWVSSAAVIGASDPRLSIHPVNLAFTVGVYSLPAVLFAGVAFWWFEQQKRLQS